ncbi:MAG: RsmB/NOP family class I SAM-dependent RNA methyltransferase, partial [Muribaculaceae bacterium]|nr:RsmB/NOP family class I SAM-dependent RNA methyltransferase [Muribaculaceae bacterium]
MTLPEEFVKMVRACGDAYAAPLLDALATESSVSVRANTLKGAAPCPADGAVPWCNTGVYLAQRPLFAADAAWHQGLYYVQDASSMVYTCVVADIAARFFNGEPLRYLDACAAPGGKSIAALEALPPESFVVANELDRRRANILYENITKHGAPNVAVTRGDASALGRLHEAFDIIAVDAPCSGEGMMRKEEEAVRQWSHSLIESCAATQRQILTSLWNALRPGGVLIYSTCTFNRSENEDNVAFIARELGGESIDLGLDRFTGVLKGFDTDFHSYRFTPGHIRGEGLFMAALRKPGDAAHTLESKISRNKKHGKEQRAPRPAGDFARAHITNAGDYVEIDTAERTELVPARHQQFVADVVKATGALRAGIPLCTVKGRDTVPCHELAMSAALAPASFAQWEVDYATAMAYLRGESIADVPQTLPKGIVLL